MDGGTENRIALGAPATENQAGYAALTPWVDLGGVISLPERGDSYTNAGEPELGDNRQEYLAALADGGELSIPIKFKENDAGQAILLDQIGTNADISWQEVHRDGTATFFNGRVMGMAKREATTTSQTGYVLKFGVNSARLVGTPVAVT